MGAGWGAVEASPGQSTTLREAVCVEADVAPGPDRPSEAALAPSPVHWKAAISTQLIAP